MEVEFPDQSPYVTVQMVRDYLLDRSIEDNELEMDLAYTDQEILQAMQRAAREFNVLPPLTLSVDYRQLPTDTNIFLQATAEQIFKSQIHKLRRNDFDYAAGGVASNLVQKRIQHYAEAVREERSLWQQSARNLKVIKNMNMAWGSY